MKIDGYHVGVNVLTPKSILSGKSHVKGYLLQQTKPTIRFVPATLPWPNVVYNRIPNRKTEKSSETLKAMTLLKQQKNIPLFNPYFFDKWSLNQTLSTIADCKPYLPATQKLADFAAFKQMVLRFPSVFLKPIHGKAGIGMMKIEGNQPYVLTVQTKQQKQKLFLPTIKKLYQRVIRLSGNQPYLLQQGISLSTFQKRPFDLRMLVQKDGSASWQLTGIGVRVAGANAISTHVPMGGKIESLDKVLSTVFPHKKEKIITQLTKLGTQFAKEIEENSGETHGEMSMDIGIDQQGKLWFFEANAKPQKFDETDIRDQSLRRIIEYSLLLSGYHRRHQGKKVHEN